MTIKIGSITGGNLEMHNHFSHQFMKKENEKRKQSQQDNRCFLINQQLNRVLKQTLYKHSLTHNHSEIKKVIQYTSRIVVSCTIVNLSYRNNYENLEVAVLQYLFVKKLLQDLNEPTYSIRSIENELRFIDNYKSVHFMERHKQFFESLSFK